MAHKKFFANYDLGEELGSGSFATVKEATRKSDGKKFAVKIIEKARLGDNQEAIKKEVSILQQVSHTNIVCMKDFHESNDKYYLVLDLMTGGELFDRIVEKGSYTEKDAANSILKVTKAIKYLHDMGIVHRDLKPENLLYEDPTAESELKLADFGFAKFLGGDDDMTQTACGTPGYVAPEILKNEGYTKQVDMWSIGVILYILLCGFPPFYDENMADLFATIMQGKYSFPDPYWSDISDSAKDLVSKLLVVDPTKRLHPDELVKHPWVVSEAKDNVLGTAQEQMRKLQAKKRLRKAVHGVMAINKMKRMFG